MVIFLALVLIVGVSAGYFARVASSHPTTNTVSTTLLVTTTSTTTAATAVTRNQTASSSSRGKNEAFLMKVNGSFYWADDVSRDISIGAPGYSYFLNGSVTFDGVKFQTICPPIYSGCPVSPGTTVQSQTILLAGAIRFSMTFPDGSTETTGQVIGDSTYTYVISQHYPRAGMLIEYVNDYPNNFVDYAVFLLVSSYCQAPYLS